MQKFKKQNRNIHYASMHQLQKSDDNLKNNNKISSNISLETSLSQQKLSFVNIKAQNEINNKIKLNKSHHINRRVGSAKPSILIKDNNSVSNMHMSNASSTINSNFNSNRNSYSNRKNSFNPIGTMDQIQEIIQMNDPKNDNNSSMEDSKKQKNYLKLPNNQIQNENIEEITQILPEVKKQPGRLFGMDIQTLFQTQKEKHMKDKVMQEIKRSLKAKTLNQGVKTQKDQDNLVKEHSFMIEEMIGMCHYFRENCLDQEIVQSYGVIFPTNTQLQQLINYPQKIVKFLKNYIQSFQKTIDNLLVSPNQTVKQKQEVDYIYNTFQIKELNYLKKEQEYKLTIDILQKNYNSTKDKLDSLLKYSNFAIEDIQKDHQDLLDNIKRQQQIINTSKKEIEKRDKQIEHYQEQLLSIVVLEKKLQKNEIKYQFDKLRNLNSYKINMKVVQSIIQSIYNSVQIAAQELATVEKKSNTHFDQVLSTIDSHRGIIYTQYNDTLKKYNLQLNYCQSLKQQPDGYSEEAEQMLEQQILKNYKTTKNKKIPGKEDQNKKINLVSNKQQQNNGLHMNVQNIIKNKNNKDNFKNIQSPTKK